MTSLRSLVLIAALVVLIGLPPARAQQPDLDASLQQFKEYYAAGNYAAALAEGQKLEAAIKAQFGANHPNYAAALNNLAIVYRAQGRNGQAEALYQRALAIEEKAKGPGNPELALTLNNLANVYEAQGKYTQAEGFHQRALAIREKAFGPGHVDVAQTLHNLSAVYYAQGRYVPAEGLLQRVLAIRARRGRRTRRPRTREPGSCSGLARAGKEADRRALQAGRPAGPLCNEALRREIAEAESRLRAVAERLEREFPDYAALASPKPLGAEEVQNLIKPDEALVFFLTDSRASTVFALTREGFQWKVIASGADDLAKQVTAFRRGLDVEAVTTPVEGGVKRELFDLGIAHDLYVLLLGSVEDLIKHKQHLLVVASGALTAVPFHMLVVEKPAATVPELRTLDDLAVYRDAAWLLKRHAVTVLPSVASLKALRTFAQKGQTTRAMIGFGDPIFDPNERRAPAAQRAARSRAVGARVYTDFWQGAGVDRAKLSQALPRLEDTADELKAVGQKLGARANDMYLRAAASETTVKRAPLAEFRVVYFATHGLVAGDIKGLGEPALALSIPGKATVDDDGLLTASEIAQLKMNADWVVLSACNTIAGDKPGAEALSGLARAFFYAGARALLVSHWAVESGAATLLTTSTFDLLKSDPKLGRAEALRRAMLAYLSDTGNPRNAYPAYWAPFVVVGEGAAQ